MNMLEILSGMCYSEKDRGNSPVSIDRYFKGTSRFTKGTLQAIHLKPRKHGTARETIQAREPLLPMPLVSGKEAGYNKNGEQMENTQKNNGRLRAREKLLERVKNFTLLSDVFLSVALRDKAACQHVLRLLTGKEKLTVKAVRTQYRISKIISHDAILDVLAEDEKKRLYNLEIQRRDTVDHSRRTACFLY